MVAALLISTLTAVAAVAGPIHGTNGDDTLDGTADGEVIKGRPGHDRIDGRGGPDHLVGASGRDTIIGGAGRDSVLGGSGNDLIRTADDERDVIGCGAGDFDQAIVDEGLDVIDPDCERVVGPEEGQLQVVSIGDSIAAGEGINYGFTWLPTQLAWSKPADPSPTWDGNYQVCHQSSKAYGNVVAEQLNAKFNKFACTGATYGQGLTGPQKFGNVSVPAQMSQLAGANLKPDVVLVSIGANDVNFSGIVRNCITSYLFFPNDPECTQSKPGSTIQNDFWNQIDTVAGHWNDVATQIQDAYQGPGKPLIVFTTYYDPLVTGTVSNKCVDNLMSPAQNTYLGSLFDEMTSRLELAVGGREGVIVANASQVMVGHTWCTDEPWAYGPGVIASSGDFSNPAPVHPLPIGQKQIAGVVQGDLVPALTAP